MDQDLTWIWWSLCWDRVQLCPPIDADGHNVTNQGWYTSFLWLCGRDKSFLNSIPALSFWVCSIAGDGWYAEICAVSLSTDRFATERLLPTPKRLHPISVFKNIAFSEQCWTEAKLLDLKVGSTEYLVPQLDTIKQLKTVEQRRLAFELSISCDLVHDPRYSRTFLTSGKACKGLRLHPHYEVVGIIPWFLTVALAWNCWQGAGCWCDVKYWSVQYFHIIVRVYEWCRDRNQMKRIKWPKSIILYCVHLLFSI